MAFLQPSVPAVCEICSEAQQSTRNVVSRLRTGFQTCTKTMPEADASNHHYTYPAAHPDRRKLESLPRLRARASTRSTQAPVCCISCCLAPFLCHDGVTRHMRLSLFVYPCDLMEGCKVCSKRARPYLWPGRRLSSATWLV